MKKFSKILSVALLVALVLSLGASAFAAEGKSITVDVNWKGQKYTLYKIFNATTNAQRQAQEDEDSETSVDMPGIAYTLIDEDTTANSGHGLTAQYTITTAAGEQKTVTAGNWFKYVNDTNKNITLVDGADITSEEFRLWAQAYGVKIRDTLEAASDNDPEIKWEGLEDGYYFISTTTGALVTVDSIAPNAIVKDKNSPPTIEKKVQEDSVAANIQGATDGDGLNAYQKQNDVEVGQTVYYRTVIHAKPGSKNYVLYDKMAEELTFEVSEKHPITVYVVDPLATGATEYSSLGTAAVDTFTSVEGEHDSATLALTGNYKHDGTDAASFILTFKDTWLENQLKKTNDNNETVPAAKDIIITYSAVLNNKAIINIPYENKTTLKYGDNNTYTSEEKTYTFTWGLDVLKFGLDKMADNYYLPADTFGSHPEDPEIIAQAKAAGYVYNPAHTDAAHYWVKDTAKKALKDAEFVIYRTETEGNTTKVFYAIFEDVTQVINEETKTIKKFKEWTAADTIETAKISDLTKKESSYFTGLRATVLTTPADGTFAVQGLDEGTYYLLETKAPAGYNKLNAAIEVVLDSTSDKPEIAKELTPALTVADSKDGSVHKDVLNNSGTTLPSTGGIGTTIFYVVGGVLVLAAIILLVTKKRMSE